MAVCPTGGQLCEPCVPCLCSCLVCCHPGVRWRVAGASGTALTIDDFPSKHMRAEDFWALLAMLEKANGGKGVRATFFVIWSRVVDRPEHQQQLIAMRNNGHEIAVHYEGRWGWARTAESYLSESDDFMAFCELNGIELRFVRPPGGFATRAFVDRHFASRMKLITVIGTAYPFDADLCECMPPAWIGRCAAGLSLGGGRIVILHAGKRLHEKVACFLRHAVAQNVGTLSDVVDEDHDVTARMLQP